MTNELIPPDLPEKFHSLFASYHNEVVRLREINNALRRLAFGRSTERHLPGELIVPAGSLFNEVEIEALKVEEIEEQPEEKKDQTEVKGHTRKVGGRKALPENLPRVEKIIDIPEEKKFCPHDGHALVRIGEEVTEKLDVIPAKLFVTQTKRQKYSCPCCEQFVIRAEPEASVLPTAQFEPGLIAYLAQQKYLYAMPLYRMEHSFKQMGVDIPRTTLARWMIAGGECLKPLAQEIKKFILSHSVVHADETFIEVHKGTGKSPVSENYMWVAASPEWSKNAVYFEYHPSRSSRAASSLLEGFKGHLQVDAYTGYDAVCKENDLIRVGCWAHVRRYFEKANVSGANSGRTLSEKILKDIKELFMLERELKELSPAERKSGRENKAPPILRRIKEKLDKNLDEVPPKSKLGEALHYLAEEWPHLEHFAHNGELALSNNRCENYIRPFVLGRKNWLFADSATGAEASASIYSIVVSAKANNIDVFEYLKDLFTQLPSLMKSNPDPNLSHLLPWNWQRPAQA
jgi:transposase